MTIEQSDSLKAERDMYQALRAQKQALEETLRKKEEELRMLCLQEGELTGILPAETPPPPPGEQAPVLRRRVGTAFALSVKNVQDVDQVSKELAQLELEVELQGKITSAAHRLASDKTVNKLVRKQRRQSYTRAAGKLKEMEKKLGDLRKQAGKTERASRAYDDPSRVGPYTKSVSRNSPSRQGHSEPQTEDQGQRTALSPSHSSPQLSASHGPSGSYGGRGNLRGQGYPLSLGNRNSSDIDSAADAPGLPLGAGSGGLHLVGGLKLDGSHDSGFSSANNMYNVSSQRTSHYESMDQLRSPAMSEPGGLSPLQSQLSQDQQAGLTEGSGKKYGSDDGGFGQRPGVGGQNLHYGSLDRKLRRYQPNVYRDVSPARGKGLRQVDERDCFLPREGDFSGQSDVLNPQGVVLEVPVHHETGPSTPGPGWREAVPHGSTDHYYSPRMYEGTAQRAYQDVDITHIHNRSHEQGLAAAHHTASQPVFHRIDRNISPSHQHHQYQQQHYHHHHHHHPQQQQLQQMSSHHADRSGIPSQQQQQHHYPQSSSSPPPHTEGPRPIPIQRVDSSSSTPPPSSPLSQNPPSLGSPGPSSPRGVAGHAPSTLVTVTRLQPHTEVTKPYETSDFYRYSEKLRRQRIIDQYQRQLIGSTDRTSRSSTPQSVESDGHSSHSGSTSQYSGPNLGALSSTQTPSYGSSSPAPPLRGPTQPYGRSSSAPLAQTGLSPYYQHLSSSPSHQQQLSSPPLDPAAYPDGQITSSSSAYSIKSHGPNVHYAMQSSTYQVQHVHSSVHSSMQSSAQHAVYHPPQPMTCKPVKTPAAHPDPQHR